MPPHFTYLIVSLLIKFLEHCSVADICEYIMRKSDQHKCNVNDRNNRYDFLI